MLLQIGEVLVQRHRRRPVVTSPVRLRKPRRCMDVLDTRHPRFVVAFVVHRRQDLQPEPGCRERYRWVDDALEHILSLPERRRSSRLERPPSASSSVDLG